MQALGAAAALCDGEEITPAHLPAWIETGGTERITPSPTETADSDIPEMPSERIRSDKERNRYLRALNGNWYPGTGRWNLRSAARGLGMPRETLVYRLKKLRLR